MSWIAVDIETVAHDCVRDYVAVPDLGAVTANKNLKDPVKVAENIEAKKADLQAEYEASVSRAALDWNLSRIVALAWQSAGDEDVTVYTCHDEDEERQALGNFWNDSLGRRIVGFCARTFDVPTLIQRSRLLGVNHPRVRIDRFGRGDVVDVRDVLTFDDARYEAIMPRSLKTFCKRFGIQVDDEIDGKDVGELVRAGKWELVKVHVRSDVALTVSLAKRVGVLVDSPAYASAADAAELF
jgi:predicted PolB exonuclease-like 3'-5' exonuclease